MSLITHKNIPIMQEIQNENWKGLNSTDKISGKVVGSLSFTSNYSQGKIYILAPL